MIIYSFFFKYHVKTAKLKSGIDKGKFFICLHFAVVKVPLRRKFCIPFSLQLLKVEVINTYHAKFYIEIPTGRPVILIVKFSFVLPPLLDSKNGREPHRELDLVAPRGIWRHTRTTTWPAFEGPISLKEATLVAQGPSLQRPRIANTRK